MAQLRRDYDQFTALDTEVVVVGPEKAEAFTRYWQEHHLPFVGLPDPTHTVLKKYGQEVNLFKFGRQPAQVSVDKTGLVRYVHYGHDPSDIPSNEELLGLLKSMNETSNAL
ncbi:MAG: redoxin domain-containing protein [Chloroflexi bacterium]|nr:redoxin domain-containing protein [Chloroflexota bacterium]